MKNNKLTRIAVGAVAAAAAAGGLAVAASSGSAGPAPEETAASKAVRQSPAVPQPGTSYAGAPRLDASRAQAVDMSRAPAEMANQTYWVTPSDKGPCLIQTGSREVAPGVIEGDSMACGTDSAPTLTITPNGTIGVVASKAETVELVGKDGATTPAAIDEAGVWFAEPGTAKAIITVDGARKQYDLLLNR